MILSADDAKTKWCPFSRVVQRQVVDPKALAPVTNLASAVNRDALGTALVPTTCRCLADGCLAWRWGGWNVTAGGPVSPNPTNPDNLGPRLGYCGLANKPYGAV